MKAESILALAGVLISATLVIITFWYARLTAKIARETAAGAKASANASRIGLLAVLLSNRPHLVIESASVTYHRGIPMGARVELRNAGLGVISSIAVRVDVILPRGGPVVSYSDPIRSTALNPGETHAWTLSPSLENIAVEASSLADQTGVDLVFDYLDVLGQSWSVSVRDDVRASGPINVRNQRLSGSLDELTKALLGEVRAP